VTGIVLHAGHSKGADSALVYASMYDDVPNVVNIAGRFDMRAGISERFGADFFDNIASEKQMHMEQNRDDGVPIEWTLTKWSLQDRLDLDMRVVAGSIKLSDVLTIHGTNDRAIPFEDAKQWGKYIANHQYATYAPCDSGAQKRACQERAELRVRLATLPCAWPLALHAIGFLPPMQIEASRRGGPRFSSTYSC
jgi:hypothetical protein